MSDVLSAIKAGIGFLTTVPVGIDMDGVRKLSKHAYLFPFIGAFIGLTVGGVGLILQRLPTHLCSALIIVALYCITGLNHLDGLADFGDGLLAYGISEEKIRVMHDPSVGVGGMFFVIMSLLILFSVITTIGKNILFAILVAEISAKQSMLTATFGKSMHKGLGSMFIENVHRHDFLIGLIFSMSVCWYVLDVSGVVALFSALLSALVIVHIANRNFGGVNGDVLGAINEVGRMVALISIGVMTWTLL
ncbi:MAG: adenosylcobinamide-GDP ribazoletransferase [Methanocellales archaeon]|nr:adenosylcobinamide-GDP ribazoletransferase [Methanocellales archaeon]